MVLVLLKLRIWSGYSESYLFDDHSCKFRFETLLLSENLCAARSLHLLVNIALPCIQIYSFFPCSPLVHSEYISLSHLAGFVGTGSLTTFLVAYMRGWGRFNKWKRMYNLFVLFLDFSVWFLKIFLHNFIYVCNFLFIFFC